MRKIGLQQCLLAGTLALGASPGISAGQEPSAIEEVFGVTPGQRRNHTKDACAVWRWSAGFSMEDCCTYELSSGLVTSMVSMNSR